MHDSFAGCLVEDEDGYRFAYDADYLGSQEAQPISLTLPLRREPYRDRTLFPFFDNLIPEGWMLEIAETTWKLDARDRMGLLLACCADCVGAVSVRRCEGEDGDG
jgi:serine/threonine-protein kinase HipA